MPKRLPPVSHCLNCEAEVASAFCPHCGQEAVRHAATVGQLIAELADGLFNLDSKLLRTLRLLVFKPGLLTVAFNAGKRVRYLSPLRLYLTCSIAFFLALAWRQSQMAVHRPLDRSGATVARTSAAPGAGGAATAPGGRRAAVTPRAGEKTESHPEPGATGGLHIEANGARVSSVEALPDTVEGYTKMLKPGEKMSPMSLFAIHQAIKIRRIGEEGIIARYLANLPNMMFLMLPVFAVVLKIIYVRSRSLYVEHLIFLLHTHAFVYILLTALLLLPKNPVSPWTAVMIPAYVFQAMRTVYRQPWWKTGLKFCLIAIGYFIVLGLCLLGTMAVTFLTI